MSEISASPKWERVFFGDLVCFAQNGCSVRRGDSGVPAVVLRLADVSVDGTVANSSLRQIELSPEDRVKYRLEYGDLLAFRVNGSPAIAGQVIHYQGPEDFTFCDHFIRFRIKEDLSDPRFAALAFRSREIRAHVEAKMVSSAGQNTVSQKTYYQIPFPLPPLNDQRRIVAKLEALQQRTRRARTALGAEG